MTRPFLQRIGVVCLAIAIGLVSAAPASAQPAQEAGNAAFGYALLKDSAIDGVFAAGWFAAVSGRVTNSIHIVGEVGSHYKTLSPPIPLPINLDVKLSVHTFLFGPRFVGGKAGTMKPFAQVLVGVTRASGQALGLSESRSGFTFQPGAGVDIPLKKAIGLRLQGDFRTFQIEGETAKELRVVMGVVIGFGGR